MIMSESRSCTATTISQFGGDHGDHQSPHALVARGTFAAAAGAPRAPGPPGPPGPHCAGVDTAAKRCQHRGEVRTASWGTMGHWVLWKRFLFREPVFWGKKIAPNFWERWLQKRCGWCGIKTYCTAIFRGQHQEFWDGMWLVCARNGHWWSANDPRIFGVEATRPLCNWLVSRPSRWPCTPHMTSWVPVWASDTTGSNWMWEDLGCLATTAYFVDKQRERIQIRVLVSNEWIYHDLFTKDWNTKN